MKNIAILFASILLVSVIGCGTTNNFGKFGKIKKKETFDKKIPNDKIGVAIYLFDVRDGSELNFENTKNIPGELIDSAKNYRLFYFDKASIPQVIEIDKSGMSPRLISPNKHKSKNNLLIYKIFMGPDLRGNI